MHENVTKLAENVDSDKLLVEIVQGLLMAHTRLDHLEKSLIASINSGTVEQTKASKEHHRYLADRLNALIKAQSAQDAFAHAESAKLTENWLNLRAYLNTWQTKLDKSFATTAADVQLSTSTVTDKLEAATADIQNWNLALDQANRRLLIWLICLSAVSVLCLGAIVYKMFVVMAPVI